MQKTVTLAANGTYTLKTNGTVFAVLSATAAFSVETDRDGKRTMATDRKFGSPGGKQFSRLTLYETAGAANTITFYVGDEDYISSTPSNTGSSNVVGKDASTYTKSHNSVTLAAGATWTFTGSDGGKQRANLTISNNDAGAVLEVLDNANNVGGYVQPLSPFPVFGNGVVKLKNPTANPVDVAVLETFYS